MMEKKNNKGLMLAAAALMGAMSSTADASTADSGKWYLGAGVGISEMEPDTGNTGYRIDDARDFGGKLYLGYELNERWSVEGYYSDLGAVTLKPGGSIGYRDFGVSGLFYFYHTPRSQKGWSIFARGGVGRMENDTQLDYKRLNDSHFMHGAGVEYGLGKGVLLRADLDLYDEDARLLSVGMRINLGGKEREPAPAPEPVVQPVPVPVAEPIPDPDSDGDGVLDRDDACPGTAVGTQVDSRGCEMERVIVLKGVTFALNSDELVGDSAAVLDEVATSLRRYPDQKVEVAGYTDSQGNDTYNRNLSQRRANSVRGYLIAQGVAAESLTAKGYGEANPIADNHTAEGRAQNRRVELRMMDNTLDAGPQGVSVAPVVAVVAAQKAVIDLCAGTTSGTEEAGTPCKLNEVTILDGVNFVISSDQLVEGSQAVLDEVAATLKRYPGQRVEIGCHTDWKGSGSSNQALSERRANTVREYLIGQGVTAELLSAKGYGEMQPVADNRTAEGREENRRVELRLVK